MILRTAEVSPALSDRFTVWKNAPSPEDVLAGAPVVGACGRLAMTRLRGISGDGTIRLFDGKPPVLDIRHAVADFVLGQVIDGTFQPRGHAGDTAIWAVGGLYVGDGSRLTISHPLRPL